MAIIKCKMCGGDLVLSEDQSVAECEYCGSRQTVPKADDEKKLLLFDRAERLRKNCEFDKAAGLYESIVADFRQESEAYWGLVLCRYGIEYVDDPVSGKKIPTCHRSSFESILEDPDLDQALENADITARRIYREESKQIEELRKGIIAVSAGEEPYDIFICYKETDEYGDRTLDSVLAQDIYDALTGRGYRVFFSRISLEDKLGIEFEPYIFAALNSAKIMLAVGTDYEYYNAVWVKNEWSRFLKLMAKDKQKHLIPCYKGLDAYDMPKEFARLQAQDLGKVGAMQDLMRGIEKLLPRVVTTAAVQPRPEQPAVIYAPNNVASLLKRGELALEDGDWTRADDFFEEVLNQDAECGEAYFGKLLAQEKCVNAKYLVEKRLDLYKTVSYSTLHIPSADDHIGQIAGDYAVAGYLDLDKIKGLYHTDNSYQSCVPCRKKQFREETDWWDNSPLFNRADRFSDGISAHKPKQYRQKVLAQLSEALQSAKDEEQHNCKLAQDRYATFLSSTDAQVASMSEAAKQRKQQETERKQRFDVIVHVLRLLNDFQSQSKSLSEHAQLIAAFSKLSSKVTVHNDAIPEICQRISESEQTLKDNAERITVLQKSVERSPLFSGNAKKELRALLSENTDLAKNAAKSALDMITQKLTSEEFISLSASIPEMTQNVVCLKHRLRTAPIGHCVTFGQYLQDANKSSAKSPIEWIVIGKESGRVLLLSRYALDYLAFHATTFGEEVTWPDCSLRYWLNSDFIQNAFTSEEAMYIATSNLSGDRNPKYNTTTCSTQDRVFLLNFAEVEKYCKTKAIRICVPTAYVAKCAGLSHAQSPYSKDGRPTCWWWLRSAGNYKKTAIVASGGGAGVGGDGQICYGRTVGKFESENHFIFEKDAVRPALWFNLNA